MNKFEGIHFYINISNFDDVVVDEESKTGEVNHSIHALDTYFSSIESYGNEHYSDTFHIEKITGSRLHMYVIDDIESAYFTMADVVSFAEQLAKYLSINIPKYKSLRTFEVQSGACFGKFYDFNFSKDEYEEETTIGYAANFAAKLQTLCNTGDLAISSNIFEAIPVEIRGFYRKIDNLILRKYEATCYYEAPIRLISDSKDYTKELKASKEYANKVNLTDMNFRKANQILKVENLSKTECKKIEGIPFFADVRGFTEKFDNDDINLDQMAKETQNILSVMYSLIKKESGIHIQFQGDCEFALFHNYPDYDCTEDAVFAGLKMIDKIQGYGIFIGVGESFGEMFATKIGAHGEKDFLVLGRTVMEADINEDDHARENQLVISPEIYENIQKSNVKLAKIFNKGDGYYYTQCGYNDFQDIVSYDHLRNSNKNHNYNEVWGE